MSVERKKSNPLPWLKKTGQSVWLDYLSREILKNGELKRLIDEDGLAGVTSNPTIFQKAISGSADYDRSIQDLLGKNVSGPKELFLSLAIEDVKEAAGLLDPVYEASRGGDGYVSIEVSPDLAYDTRATMEEARRLFSWAGKRNILVKVPATKEGLPAIEQLISEGINVNTTLLFSVGRYKEVIGAYLSGLEKRLKAGKPVDHIASVASFFVSRVDTLADKLLSERYKSAPSDELRQKISSLYGKAAVANAVIAYDLYKKAFAEKRFTSMKDKGARIQRILWASTSTKNPRYSDIKYVEELIAADSVNTMPEETIKAFKDHGKVKTALPGDIKNAEKALKELKSVGVDIDEVTKALEADGVEKFSESFRSVMDTMAEKRTALLARK